jgi:hypothetical protein
MVMIVIIKFKDSEQNYYEDRSEFPPQNITVMSPSILIGLILPNREESG